MVRAIVAAAIILVLVGPGLVPSAGAIIPSDRYDSAQFYNADGGLPVFFWQRPPVSGSDVMAFCAIYCNFGMNYADFAAGDLTWAAVGGFGPEMPIDGPWDFYTSHTSASYHNYARLHDDRIGFLRIQYEYDPYYGYSYEYEAPCDATNDVAGGETRRYYQGYGDDIQCYYSNGPGTTITHPYNYNDLPQSGSFFDHDGDGNLTSNEINEGSHPHESASRLDTDDDGDGTWNKNEGGTTNPPMLCTGAYGVVRGPACNGYAAAPCSPAADPVCVDNAAVKRIWAWDSFCRPGTGGSYSSCKGVNSNYQLNPTPYGGNFESDGYGWRMMGNVPVLGPTVVSIPELCTGSPIDEDDDGLHKFSICRREWTVTPQGSVSSNPNQSPYLGPYGDSNDQNDQVPVPTKLVTDHDGDGDPTANEVDAGSHFESSASRPTTDDDGDGTANRDEPSSGTGTRALCTGTFGIVWRPTCGGYAAPQGVTYGGILLVEPGVSPTYYVWDAYCNGSYASCASSSQRTQPSPVYFNTMAADGYGWRNLGQPLTPKTVTVPQTCDSPMVDADADGSPLVRRCERDLTLRPDGSFEWSDERFIEAVGDPDDADNREPLPAQELQAALAELQQAGEETAQIVIGMANTLVGEVGQLIDQANETASGALEPVDTLAPFVESTRSSILNTTGRFYDGTLENATGLASLTTCLDAARAQYIASSSSAAGAYLGNPSPSNQQNLQFQLVFGFSAFTEDVSDCDASGQSADLVKSVFDGSAAAFFSYVDSLNATIAASQDRVQAVRTLIGPTAEVLNQTLEVGFFAVEFAFSSTRGYVVEVMDRASELFSQVAAFDYARLASDTFSENEPKKGKADLVFFVQDSEGRAIGSATIQVYQDSQLVANHTTSERGDAVIEVESGKTYRYAASKTGYKGAGATITAPADGEELEVTVTLQAAGVTQLSLAAAGPWVFSAVLAGLLLIVLLARRRR